MARNIMIARIATGKMAAVTAGLPAAQETKTPATSAAGAEVQLVRDLPPQCCCARAVARNVI